MFGIVMCLLYIKTKNIWTNIAVHALNNFIATSMQFVGGEESSAISIPELQAQSNLHRYRSYSRWITLVNSLRLETMAYGKRSGCATSALHK